MTIFYEAMFDSWFPDEEGPVEARKRLERHAKHFCRMRGWTLNQWLDLLHKDPETRYYVSLIGGQTYAEHLGMLVWYPTKRNA